MERACISCLDLISQKKTSSTDNNLLTRKPYEYHQMLPHYEGVYKPKPNIIDFESAREVLMEKDYKMIVKRRFERIYNLM